MIRANGLVPILNVSDMQQSFDWFVRLGWEKRWDWGSPPDFGCVGSGGCEIFLCLNDQGGRNDHGMWICVMVDDPDAMHAHAIANGIEVLSPPRDYEWNMREMLVRHPDGHAFRIGRPLLENMAHEDPPPIPITRVDVPVRLERRLAALLHDLAALKGMSLASCLEETLLHTIDGVGPHTAEQLDAIQALKTRHGIDYDSHGSYRFVEE